MSNSASGVGGINEYIVAPALIDAGERAHVGARRTPGELLDLLQVCDGQRLDLADAAHDDEPIRVRARSQAAEPGVNSLQQPEKQEGNGDR